jgi:hypothetical protein
VGRHAFGRTNDLPPPLKNFISGAKLMWGGEAVAVRHDGRANPHQLMLTPATQKSIGSLRDELISAHRERFGSNADSDLYLGLQITHSGRFARPDVWNVSAPLAACPHPILDKRFAAGVRVFTDDELDRLIDDYIAAARLAYDCGFQFVDAKACHGYLGHELLGATTRTGKYGGPLKNRMRFITQIVDGIHSAVPGLGIVVRVSMFDMVPHRKSEGGAACPSDERRGPGFGVLVGEDMDGALNDGRALFSPGITRHPVDLRSRGSPCTQPSFSVPPSFLRSTDTSLRRSAARVARQIDATSRLKAEFPRLVFVSSAYSYLRSGCRMSVSTTCATGWPISSVWAASYLLSRFARRRAERAACAAPRSAALQRLRDRPAPGHGVGCYPSTTLRSAAGGDASAPFASRRTRQ